LNDAVREARHISQQNHERQLRDDYFSEDGTPKIKEIQMPQPDGSWKLLQVPLISLVRTDTMQIQQVCFGFEASIIGGADLVEGLTSKTDFEITLGKTQDSIGTPAYINVRLGGESGDPDQVHISFTCNPVNGDGPEVDRFAIERELRMVAIDSIGGFSGPEGSALLVTTPTHFYDKPPAADAWRFSSKYDSELSNETVEAFFDVNRKPSELTANDFSLDPLFDVEVIERGNLKSFDWVTFEELEDLGTGYPQGIFRIVEMSQFGWAPDGSECLFYLGWLLSEATGRGRFYAFRRHGSQYSCNILPKAPSWNNN
jgi:hypothetical protein